MAKHIVKKKKSEHQLHAMIVTFSVLAGLALAACQPKMTQQRTSTPQPSQAPTQETQIIVSSPVPNGESTGEVKGVSDPAFDSALQQMDNTLQQTDPNNVNGKDLQ